MEQDISKNLNNEPVALRSYPPKKWYRRAWFLVAAVLVVIAAGAVAAVYLQVWPQNQQPGTLINNQGQHSISGTTTANTPPPRAEVIGGDRYGLFMQTSSDKMNNFTPEVKYADDGMVDIGKFAGYHRLLAFRSANDPSGGYSYMLATKDYQTFVLDSSTYPEYADPNSDLNGSDSVFNKTKISGIDIVPTDFPKNINQDNFVLVRGNADWNASATAGEELAGSVANLRFFTEIMEPFKPFEGASEDYKKQVEVKNRYISGTTRVLAVDPKGVAFDYVLVSEEEYERSKPGAFDLNFYKKNDLVSQSGLYEEYGQLFPGGCGQANLNYIVKDISENDLVKIAATKQGVTIYTLNDANHPLNQQEYFSKVTAWRDEFQQINRVVAPSFQDYVAKNPVLVLKDTWGRWMALGEWQYLTGGGCGKPVVYLYPDVPTKVSVKFLNPMRFSADIPTYANGWKVVASPDGTLKDLQPQQTDCRKINFNLLGSGYAFKSCQTGLYPYLYWAGQTAGDYPKPTGGWIVARADIERFLNNKLIEVGLNDKERMDMVSYWIPQLLKKDAPFYRLSFFQTQELNKFVPMEVTPKPATVFRIFLDWEALSSEPKIALKPQALQRLNRGGFTLVEWGGIKY